VDALRRRKEQQELEANDALQSMERAHMKAAHELETLYERKLAIESSRSESGRCVCADLRVRVCVRWTALLWRRYKQLQAEKDDLECSGLEQLEMMRSAAAMLRLHSSTRSYL
jgi:hypothetical protein